MDEWEAADIDDDDDDFFESERGDNQEAEEEPIEPVRVIKLLRVFSRAEYLAQKFRLKKLSVNLMSTQKVVSIIESVYAARRYASATESHRDFGRFLYDYFLRNFGLKSIAESNLYSFLRSMKATYGKKVKQPHLFILIFCKFLEMYQKCACTLTLSGKCECGRSQPLSETFLLLFCKVFMDLMKLLEWMPKPWAAAVPQLLLPLQWKAALHGFLFSLLCLQW